MWPDGHIGNHFLSTPEPLCKHFLIDWHDSLEQRGRAFSSLPIDLPDINPSCAAAMTSANRWVSAANNPSYPISPPTALSLSLCKHSSSVLSFPQPSTELLLDVLSLSRSKFKSWSSSSAGERGTLLQSGSSANVVRVRVAGAASKFVRSDHPLFAGSIPLSSRRHLADLPPLPSLHVCECRQFELLCAG